MTRKYPRKRWLMFNANAKNHCCFMDADITNIEKDQEQISADGVDLTLIRWMLSLTPMERLQTLQNNVRSILRLRDCQIH